jgi:hypothetical protein
MLAHPAESAHPNSLGRAQHGRVTFVKVNRFVGLWKSVPPGNTSLSCAWPALLPATKTMHGFLRSRHLRGLESRASGRLNGFFDGVSGAFPTGPSMWSFANVHSL